MQDRSVIVCATLFISRSPSWDLTVLLMLTYQYVFSTICPLCHHHSTEEMVRTVRTYIHTCD